MLELVFLVYLIVSILYASVQGIFTDELSLSLIIAQIWVDVWRLHFAGLGKVTKQTAENNRQILETMFTEIVYTFVYNFCNGSPLNLDKYFY